jgi:hypothetical protein
MTQFLLCLPLSDEAQKDMPPIPPGAFVGCLDSVSRRLVFILEPVSGLASLYLESEGWDRPFPMPDGRLPDELHLDPVESEWAADCWKAVQAQLKIRIFR